ncbi:MAG: nuclear transport factor 2 family protein [Pseudomonadota bacterium]
MKTDCAQICAVAGSYIEALHRGDVDMLYRLFLPLAYLYGCPEGKLQAMPIADYLDLVANRQSPKAQGYPCTGNIVSIDMAGPYSSVVKVNVAVPPKEFVDLLSFVRVEGHWRIISKIYHASAS